MSQSFIVPPNKIGQLEVIFSSSLTILHLMSTYYIIELSLEDLTFLLDPPVAMLHNLRHGDVMMFGVDKNVVV